MLSWLVVMAMAAAVLWLAVTWVVWLARALRK
jgi:hypothetical protein